MDHSMHSSEEGTPKEYAKFIAVLLLITLLAYGIYRFTALDFMPALMGVFFVIFALFKLLDLNGFVASYIGYDIVAKRFTSYAYLYPFIELGLGIAYLSNAPTSINWVTLFVTVIGSIGVGRELLRKSHIKCACLGTYIKLPLTTVSLVEDVGMGIMAIILLIK
jgi:hypothetical protein